MATPPSTARVASWNPAVPPPPVTGASVGFGLGDAAGDELWVGEALLLADSDVLAEVLSLAGELAEVLSEEDAGEWGAVGERTDGEVDGGGEVPPGVQAESATQASTVVRAQPTAVSLTRCAVHGMAVRAFIGPPHTPGNDHFPVAGRETGAGRENVRPAFGRWPGRPKNSSGENAGTITVRPGCGANTQWHAHQRNIRLLE